MATPQKEPIRAVASEEQAALERLVRGSSARVDQVRRGGRGVGGGGGGGAGGAARPGGGEGFAAAARQAGFGSSTTVAKLVVRFNRQGLAAVRIAAGRGRKPTYDLPARARIVATAQRSPDRKTDGTATWSLSTLERTLRRGGVPPRGGGPGRRGPGAGGGVCTKARAAAPS